MDNQWLSDDDQRIVTVGSEKCSDNFDNSLGYKKLVNFRLDYLITKPS